jgi:hypothetical protein
LNPAQIARFNRATRQSFLQLQPLPYSANGLASIQLPQVGFLAEINIPVEFNVVASMFTGGDVLTAANEINNAPFNLIRRITLKTNEGAEIYNTTGIENYYVQRAICPRTGYDIMNPSTAFSAGYAHDSVFRYVVPSSGATQTLRFNIKIPVSWGEQNQAGLILLQNPTTRLTLEILWSDGTGIFTTDTGATYTINSVTTEPEMVIFNVPASEEDYPDLSLVHVILSDVVSVTNTGDFLYRPPLGNAYLKIFQQFVNNNARVDLEGFMNRMQLTYAQTQNAYTITPKQQLRLQAERLGIALPDGGVLWDFTYGSGILEYGNTRDVINTMRLTDMSVISTISSGGDALVNSTCSTIREMLAPIRR